MPNNTMPRLDRNPPVPSVPSRKRRASGFENEGEGSLSAARNYDNATAEYVKSGRVEEAAKKAVAALDGQEADELRDAELATRATEPGNGEGPTEAGSAPEAQSEDGFEVPELMKDASEDRE